MGEKRADYVPKDLKKVENLNVRLSKKDYRVFKKLARKRKVTLSHAARELIVNFINEPANRLR